MSESSSSSSDSRNTSGKTSIYSAPTSENVSAPSSPAPSIYSITPSIIQSSFRTLHGRRINNHSGIYQLPADEQEFLRLDATASLLDKAMKPHYDDLSRCLSDDNREVTKACLDLGSGSGQWAQHIASTYEHASVVGVDLVPVQTMGPPNLRFEVDDINLGLEHFFNSFDVVHSRMISAGIKDYYGLVDQISRILRPKGLVLLSDWDYRVYNESKDVIVVPTGSKLTDNALPHWIRLVSQTMRRLGANLDAASLFKVWLKQHHRFQNVKVNDIWIPCDPKLFEFWRDFLNACRPMLFAYAGITPESLSALEAAVLKQAQTSQPRMYIRLLCASARRI